MRSLPNLYDDIESINRCGHGRDRGLNPADDARDCMAV